MGSNWLANKAAIGTHSDFAENRQSLNCGGYNENGNVAELYDPGLGTWTNPDPLMTARSDHTANLLPSGKVLVVGGKSPNGSSLSNAEIFNPDTGSWNATDSLATARVRHRAALLTNGKVLVIGGYRGTGVDASAFFGSTELFDPNAEKWTPSGSLTTARFNHSAALLPDGRVLVTGGGGSSGRLSSAETYDPDSEAWTTVSALNFARINHVTTLIPNGRLLVTGGFGVDADLSSTEMYDSSNGTWTNSSEMITARYLHTATLLSDGSVLVAGGTTNFSMNGFLSSSELYHPSNGMWTPTGRLTRKREEHTATLLPSGKVLVAGGQDTWASRTFSAELYHSETGSWQVTGSMRHDRYQHTASLLRNGKVLVAGGYGNTAELYDPATGSWRLTGDMKSARYVHTATLLPSGKVLVTGGYNGGTLSSAETYDPATEAWNFTGPMSATRFRHSATLLPNGKVLVVGGAQDFGITATAELYDPATEDWTAAGVILTERFAHSALLLNNGKVLVAGGFSYDNGEIHLSSSEEYDPINGAWTQTSILAGGRDSHTLTLLPTGMALVVGGSSESGSISCAELYDVGLGFSNSWRPGITSAILPHGIGGSLHITGTKLRGIAGASSGKSQDSPTDYPLVQLRSIESGQTTFLQTTNWSTNSFTSLPVWNFPPGWAMVTVFVNGIPSTSSIVNITVPTPVETALTDIRRLTNGTIQFAFTNNPGAVFGVLATTNLSLPPSNWTALGGVTENSPGQFRFTDPQASTNAQRFYRLRAP